MRYALLLLLPLLAACGEKLPPEKPVDTVKLVKALKVGAGDTAAEHQYSGEVRARIETALAFRVGGKLVERRVEVGTRVRAGEVLARLDPADQRLAAVQAEANRALAAAELQRTRELRAKNFVSAAALDARQTAAQAAEAQAQLAKNQAAYTTLTADAPGVVVAVLAEPGQVVGAGQPVFRIARDGEREVAIAIPESRIAGLKVGAGATATLWAGDGEKAYRGVLRELAPAADPVTRTFAARVRLPDADAAVALGMTAAVRFTDKAAPQIVVPLAAILQQGEKPAVWVIGTDGTLSQRPIVVARYADDGAVVASGLQPGETIVAAGAFRLAAGEQVKVANP
jgi:RND family efflux transporter MFP subunit